MISTITSQLIDLTKFVGIAAALFNFLAAIVLVVQINKINTTIKTSNTFQFTLLNGVFLALLVSVLIIITLV